MGGVGSSRAEWAESGRSGLSGVGEGVGMHWETILRETRPWAGSGRVGPSRAEWGWGGVGHALGFNYFSLRLGAGYKDRPSGAGSGRVGPSRAG